MGKNTILKGTLILTLAGLLTRLMGFFYKIYLSNQMTAESLGLYQLIFPIYGLCFTLYGSGIQTSISQLIANRPKDKKKILATGMVTSLSIAFALSILLYWKCDWIAFHILMEGECASSLKVLSLVFPFCGITSCIHGYYLGLKETKVPAAAQLFEQVIRIISVFFIASILGRGSAKVTCELAVLGIVLGEIGSNVFCIFSFKKQIFRFFTHKSASNENAFLFGPFSKLALPLTGTRVIVSLLHSLESILIPFMLKVYGQSGPNALSTYGVLTGMTMPFITFPSTITNSFAVLILPAVSEAQSASNLSHIKRTAEISIKYSLLLGLYSTCVFFLFGDALGNTFFHNAAAGRYIAILSWLCPFMYLSTTLGSIINGLGKAHITFFNTTLSLGVRILFLCFLVPAKGLYGYLIGLLASQLLIAAMDYFTLAKYIPVSIHSADWILKPGIILAAFGLLFSKLYTGLKPVLPHTGLFLLGICAVLGICYLILLMLMKIISLDELR